MSNVVSNAIKSFHATFCIQDTFTVYFDVTVWVVSHLTYFLAIEPLEHENNSKKVTNSKHDLIAAKFVASIFVDFC